MCVTNTSTTASSTLNEALHTLVPVLSTIRSVFLSLWSRAIDVVYTILSRLSQSRKGKSDSRYCTKYPFLNLEGPAYSDERKRQMRSNQLPGGSAQQDEIVSCLRVASLLFELEDKKLYDTRAARLYLLQHAFSPRLFDKTIHSSLPCPLYMAPKGSLRYDGAKTVTVASRRFQFQLEWRVTHRASE